MITKFLVISAPARAGGSGFAAPTPVPGLSPRAYNSLLLSGIRHPESGR